MIRKKDFYDIATLVLWREAQAKAKTAQSRPRKEEMDARNDRCVCVKEVGRSGGMSLIAGIEKQMIQNDLERYASSERQIASLQNGLKEVTSIELGIESMKNREAYRKMSETYFQNKVQDRQGLPKDPARLAFRSHLTRLENLDASRMDKSEKDVIVIPSIRRTLETTPPPAGHPSIEGNKTEPSVFAFIARSAKIIPLYGGVARSAGVVRAACYASVVSVFNCVNYYIKEGIGNIRIAEKLYIEMQKEVLGVDKG
jgi:hypothetical protein